LMIAQVRDPFPLMEAKTRGTGTGSDVGTVTGILALVWAAMVVFSLSLYTMTSSVHVPFSSV